MKLAFWKTEANNAVKCPVCGYWKMETRYTSTEFSRWLNRHVKVTIYLCPACGKRHEVRE